MKQFQFYFLLGMIVKISDSHYTCKPYDPDPANGVQIEKVQGLWYGLLFKPEQNERPCNIHGSAFIMNLKLSGNNIMEARESLRPREFREVCLTATNTNRITSNPAMWRWQQFFKFGNRTVDFRILATDYKNYLVRWTCGTTDKEGKCIDFLVAIWSRKPTMFPPSIFNKVFRIVKAKLCLDINTFIRGSFENVCPLPPSQVRNKRRY